MRLVLAMTALALCAAPLHAADDQDQMTEELKVGSGIICDTREQAVRIVALRNEGNEMPQAVLAVNREASNPQACGPAMVAVSQAEEVQKERMDGRSVTVTKMTVKAISDGTSWAKVPDTVQYAIVIPAGEEI
jgi:hypothetical protein